MKHIRAIKLLTLLAALLLAGCQPANDKLTTASLEKLITDSKGTGRYTADATWQDSIYTGRDSFTVEIDADIIVPDVDKYPVVAFQPVKLSDEWLQHIFTVICEGKEFEYTDYTRPGQGRMLFKPQLEETSGSSLGKDEKSQFVGLNTTYAETMSAVSFYAGNNWTETDGKQTGYVSNYLQYRFDSGNNRTTADLYVVFDNIEVTETIPSSVSREQATDKINGIIAALGDENLRIYSLDPVICEYENQPDSAQKVKAYMGWQATLAQYVGDIPVTPDMRFSTNAAITEDNAHLYDITEDELTEENHIPLDSRYYERIWIIIGDSGLLSAEWSGQNELGDIINDDVKLLPFSDIKLIILNNYANNAAKNMYAHLSDALISSKHSIHTIELGLMQTTAPDGSLRLLPVWDVYAKVESQYDRDALRLIYSEIYNVPDYALEDYIDRVLETDKNMNDAAYKFSLMTVNAIDGSIINRNRGY